MKNVKKIVICLAIVLSAITFNVQAKVRDDVSEYTTDVYVIGSTRFDKGYIVTASRAANAGADEAFVQNNVYKNTAFRGKDIKTYYYSKLDSTWSEVLENNGGLRELTTDEVNKIVGALDIFYVNNVEKTLEVPFNKPVDENSIVGPFSGEAKVENNKIIIPATWINGFSFTSEKANVEVEMGLGEENGTLDEYEEPIIRMDAKVEANLPSEVEFEKEFEFSLTVKANGNEGKEMTATGSITSYNNNSLSSLKYYDESTSSWKEISNLGDAFGNTLKDATIKYKATLNYNGENELNFSLNTADGKTYKTSNKLYVYDEYSVVLVNGVDYMDMEAAIASNPNGTFKFLKDYELTFKLSFNGNVTLDLNGKTISIPKGLKIASVKNGNLTVKNGTIKGMDYALQAEDDSTLTVDKDVNIILDDKSITKNKYGITYWDNSTVNFSGNITVTGDSFGISGNGGKANTGKLNITGGTITALEGAGIYQPNYGETTISGGTINANTGISIRSGKLNITAGKINATGAKTIPSPRGGGINTTGDAIYIEENSSYVDNIKINISGGEIKSENGYIIQEVNPTTDQFSEVTGLYSTRHILMNDGVVTYYYDDEEANFEVTENGVTNKYECSDFSTLLNAVKDGSTVKLLNDVSISKAFELNNGKITLDLNGKTLNFTEKSSKLRIRYNTNLTVKNGTIKGMDYTLQPEDDSTLTVEKDVNIVLDDKSITKNKYGIAYWDKSTVNFEGNITVTGDSIGISGNGGVSNTGKLNITGGTITATDGAGLYLPNAGTTIISGGKIIAGTVLNIKAGSLEITAGEFKATGDKKDPSATTGQNNNTGDVIIIEENASYQDHVKVNVTGGTFESVNGYIIQEYNPTLGTENELTSVITGLYTVKNNINENTFYYTLENK